MSARNYVFTIGAGATVPLPAGRFFYVRTAAAAIDIVTQGNPGAPVSFIGVGAGAKFGPVAEGQGWRFLNVTSASAQNLEIIVSDDGNFEIASAVTITGAVTVAESPSGAVATPAAVAVVTATASTIAANLSRRRITICALSTNTGSMFVQAVGAGAGRGVELQPGLFLELKTTASIDVRNDSGANQTYTTTEET